MLGTEWNPSLPARLCGLALAALVLLGLPSLASAHKPSDSYLNLRVSGTRLVGQWDIALRDLEHAIGLDANDDGAITWGELRSRLEAVDDYALARLKLRTDGGVKTIRITDHLVDSHTDGMYAVLRFEVDGSVPCESLEIDYHLLFDVDPQHRGLLCLTLPEGTRTAVFGPDRSKQCFGTHQPSPTGELLAFGGEGVWHIWLGFDHILFLLTLLLPAVLRRDEARWSGVERFRPAIRNVIQTVSAFTVAHSLTLSMATLGVVTLPSRLVESAIAASVVLAGLNNVVPFFRGRVWLVAFIFGLIHGFGFATVLRELGLEGGTLLRALVGFNLGVEAGQLAIVGCFLPLAYCLRASWLYRCLTFRVGSAMITLVASVWLVERALGYKWMPF